MEVAMKEPLGEIKRDTSITMHCVHPIDPRAVAEYLVENKIMSVARSSKIYEDIF